MNDVFEEEAKLRKWMDVEIALAKVHAELGRIPKEAPKKIEQGSRRVELSRVLQIEHEIHHDLMAMVKALSEQSGDYGAYVHLGATSYDIEDTATALIFRDALSIIKKRLLSLSQILKSLALKHRKTVCIGRTHGQHAVPTTYGMKFALYYTEVKRHLQRMEEAEKRILVGKMSGATGTRAAFGKDGEKIEKRTMELLGLSPVRVSNQVVQRDRHAEVLSLLALTAATAEKIAKEIRNLSRPEIAEVAEAFGKKQVGSSTMPHKRNPHKSERICSLARLVRANVQTAIENIPLEHERDLTNSANERFIFSESFIVTDYILSQLSSVLEGLELFPENIKRNLELTKGLVMAERVMIYLVDSGKMGRQDAHELMRTLAQDAFAKKKHLKDLMVEKKLLKKDEAERLFDYSTYLGDAETIVADAIRD